MISEDEWLSQLYPKQINSFDDYLLCSSLLKPVIKAHVVNLLAAGLTVVLDFPANTLKQRCWFKEIFHEADAAHEFFHVDVSDEVCLKQIKQRSIDSPERAAFDTDTMFYAVSRYFQAPEVDEGFNIQVIT